MHILWLGVEWAELGLSRVNKDLLSRRSFGKFAMRIFDGIFLCVMWIG